MVVVTKSSSGLTRILRGAQLAVRALEVAFEALPTSDKLVRDRLLRMYRDEHPDAMFKPEPGSLAPRGYYVLDNHLEPLRRFLRNPHKLREAETFTLAGAFYGAGRRASGGARRKIAANVLGETIELDTQRPEQITELLEALSQQVETLLKENTELQSQKIRAVASAAKLREQMIMSGLKPRYRVTARAA